MINKRERKTGRNIGKERGERERAGAGRGDTRWRGEKRCQNLKKDDKIKNEGNDETREKDRNRWTERDL